MVGFSGGPSTPIEQISELGDTIIQKLVAAGITTVESLADMTPEQLEEIPGIGEKTLERISVAVRHYFGQYEEGENRPAETEPTPEVSVAEETVTEEIDADSPSTEPAIEPATEPVTEPATEPADATPAEPVADAERAAPEATEPDAAQESKDEQGDA